MSFRARSNDSVEGCKRADSIGSYLNLVKFSDDGLGRGSPLECVRCFVVAANDEGKIRFCDSNLALSVRHRQLAEFEDIP